MAKFLFCLPRYHTNAVPWTRILLKAGHHIMIDVAGFGPTENWDYVKPLRHEPGRLCRKLFRGKINGPDGMFYVFPDLKDYWIHLKHLNPDVVIVRGVTRWFPRIVAAFALLQGRKLVIYDQEDVAPRRWSSTWFRRAIFHLIGVPHMTPRLEKGNESGGCGEAIPLPFGCPFSSVFALTGKSEHNRWPPRILMVGKYRERKGHVQLLKALAMVAKHSKFTVTFCGEEVSEADTSFCKMLRMQADKLGISNRVEFQNNVQHSQMLQLYQSHGLVVLPSWLENGGISPVEGAWAGCAVLISQDLGTRGYFPPGREYHFNPHDPSDIARALEGIFESPAKLATSRSTCQSYIARVASDDKIIATFEAFIRYNRLISS